MKALSIWTVLFLCAPPVFAQEPTYYWVHPNGQNTYIVPARDEATCEQMRAMPAFKAGFCLPMDVDVQARLIVARTGKCPRGVSVNVICPEDSPAERESKSNFIRQLEKDNKRK